MVRHNFPADGKYVFRASLYFRSLGPLFGDNKPAEGEQLEIAVNGERVALFDINRKMKVTEDLRTPPFPVKAGPQTVSAAFIQRSEGPVQDFVMPFEQATADLTVGNVQGLTGLPHLRNLGIDGPYDVTGVSDTPSRHTIFSCRPTDDREELSCAREIISRLARQAFRRPVSDRDVQRLMDLYESGRQERDFDSGIRMAAHALVADPEFLFRFERTPAGVLPGSNYRVSDLELASRLSYFLWSSAPDEELLTLASADRLSDSATLEQQVRRMLAAPRADALTTSFASHWLRLQNLKDSHPDVLSLPRLGSEPVRVNAPRNRVVLRQHRARGPVHRRSSHGGLHVRRSEAGSALRDPERHWQAVPTGAGCRFRTVVACWGTAAS